MMLRRCRVSPRVSFASISNRAVRSYSADATPSFRAANFLGAASNSSSSEAAIVARAATLVHTMCEPASGQSTEAKVASLQEAFGALHEASLMGAGHTTPLDTATRQVFANAVVSAIRTACTASSENEEVPKWVLDDALFSLGTLSAVDASLHTLPHLHDLPGLVVPPLLQASRLNDAVEAVVLCTQLGIPLHDGEKMQTLGVVLDVADALISAGTPLAAVKMFEKLETQAVTQNSTNVKALTEICNSFMQMFAEKGSTADVRTVAAMMTNQGVPANSDTVKMLRSVAPGTHNGRPPPRSDDKKSHFGKLLFAALLVGCTAALYAASEQGLALLKEQREQGNQIEDRGSLAEEYEWALQEKHKTQQAIANSERQQRDSEQLAVHCR